MIVATVARGFVDTLCESRYTHSTAWITIRVFTMRRTILWGVGIAVVLLIAGVTWLGTQPEPQKSVSMVVVGTRVSVVAPPVSGRAKVPTPLTWSVAAPVGSFAAQTAIRWGTVSKSGDLGLSVTPQAAGYPNFIPDYTTGTFALPREFSSAVTIPATGTYAYRAYAAIGGKHYWSPEYTIRVE